MKVIILKITLFTALCTLSNSNMILLHAQKPDKKGGGAQPEYSIVDLAAPDSASNFGWSPVPESISDVASDGTVYIVGNYESLDGTRAARWNVSATGDVVVEDLGQWLWEHDLDVNSAGIISGQTVVGRSPTLLLPGGQLVGLNGGESGTPLRLNNPDEFGVFQVVGRNVLWDVTVDGSILTTTPLVDPNGTQLYAKDINVFGEIAGYIDVNNLVIPAIGSITSTGQLQISTRINPNPAEIVTFWDFQIDDGGNLLGYGIKPAEFGVSPRAVIWPASEGAIDLVDEQHLDTAQGNGIAQVNGVMQVVGYAYGTSGGFAYIYSGGELRDLNGVSAGDQPWDLFSAAAINRSGMICGHGKVGKRRNYEYHGFLLIPNSY